MSFIFSLSRLPNLPSLHRLLLYYYYATPDDTHRAREREKFCKFKSNQGSSVVGIPFSRDFHKGEDYDWRYFFAPSPLSSTPHVQIKSKFKTDILLRSDNSSREIIFFGSYFDYNGMLLFPSGTKLRFVDETVAEPLGTGATITSLGFAVYIAHRIQKYRVAG